MRLDRNICLGGRFNNKDIIGIRFNRQRIYPIKNDNVYVITYSFEGDEKALLMTPSSQEYTVTESIDSNGLTIKEIDFGAANMRSITFPSNTKNIIRLKGTFSAYYFSNCRLLETADLSETNISNVTYMGNMFSSCNSLIELNLSTWDTNNVTIMGAMFANCNSLTTINGVSNFNTSNVTIMYNMFSNCYNLTELNLSTWITDNVTDMGYMFVGCRNLAHLDLSNFDTSNVTNTDDMFSGCNALCTLKLNNCSSDTINKIITSEGFPTGLVNGEKRRIYCKRENAAGLAEPDDWEFIYIDEQVMYDEPTKTLFVPESTIEVTEEQLTVSENFITYDADNENLNIN